MRTSFITFSAISLLTLAACSTPLQQCISSAQAQRDQISLQVEVAEGNIARGYAVHRQSVPYTFTGVCYDEFDVRYACEQTERRIVETPVTIDIGEERLKLANLQRQFINVKVRADAEILQCRVLHAE